ncbi:MAG: LPXTG cell wall anchor domain-containing protein [Oscillospiraceae bacterium]|nr:LPXTG cell wall anchor domain-containing protein [Oscillospiraceae bacterium]
MLLKLYILQFHLLPAPDTGDTTMIGAYVAVMLVAAAGAIVVLKKKKHA